MKVMKLLPKRWYWDCCWWPVNTITNRQAKLAYLMVNGYDGWIWTEICIKEKVNIVQTNFHASTGGLHGKCYWVTNITGLILTLLLKLPYDHSICILSFIYLPNSMLLEIGEHWHRGEGEQKHQSEFTRRSHFCNFIHYYCFSCSHYVSKKVTVRFSWVIENFFSFFETFFKHDESKRWADDTNLVISHFKRYR